MPPGPSAVKAMQRLARILAVLDDAGVVGATTEQLLEVAEYGGQAAPQDQLSLDLRNLKKQGWQIENLNPKGESARYRMVSGDNRLQVRLSPPQRAALQRAVLLAARDDLAKRLGVSPAAVPEGIGSIVIRKPKGDKLSLALQSVQLRSRIRFSYKGTARLVHPGSVRFQNYKWYLSGVEEGADLVKHFVVSEMSDITLDPPGTADEVPEIRRIPLHPLRWEVDEPTQVTLRASSDFVPDVVRWLNEPDSHVERGVDVELTYTVTHRQAFRARLYVLGPRVTITQGAQVYDELIAELREMAGL
jgi:predicted DNA-binding transcriptional regulator YafY